MLSIEDIAKICHQANKAYCESIGDLSQVDWMDAPQWQQESAINGVKFNLENPNAPASASHDSWLDEKIKCGWIYGEIKDVDKKQHPCVRLYEHLPKEQQLKDHLFKKIVSVFFDEIDKEIRE